MIYICYFRQNVSFQKKRILFEKSVDKTYLMCYYIQVVWNGSLAQLGEHLPYKQRVTGSSPVAPIIYGRVVQLVRMPACHAGGRGFEPLLGRIFASVAQ